MKSLVIAGMLFFLFLILLAFLVPYAYHYVTEGVVVDQDEEGEDIEMGLDDVPGGGIVSGLAFVIGVLVLVVVGVLKILDLI